MKCVSSSCLSHAYVLHTSNFKRRHDRTVKATSLTAVNNPATPFIRSSFKCIKTTSSSDGCDVLNCYFTNSVMWPYDYVETRRPIMVEISLHGFFMLHIRLSTYLFSFHFVNQEDIGQTCFFVSLLIFLHAVGTFIRRYKWWLEIWI